MDPRNPEPAEGSPPPIQPRYGPTPLETEFGGPNLLEVIWQGRWIVLGITFISLLAGFAYISKATPIYEGTSKVNVSNNLTFVTEDDVTGIIQSKDYVYAQADLLTSSVVLESVLFARKDLSRIAPFVEENSPTQQAVDSPAIPGPSVDEEPSEGETKRVEKDPDPKIPPAITEVAPGIDDPLEDMETFRGIKEPLKYLKEQLLEVSVGKEDKIISVTARSPNNEEAAIIANAVVHAYIRYHDEKKESGAQDRIKILEELKRNDNENNDADAALLEFWKKKPLVFEDAGQDPEAITLGRKFIALEDAENEATEASITLKALQGAKDNPILLASFLPPSLSASLRTTEEEYTSNQRELRFQIKSEELKLDKLLIDRTPECPATRDLLHRIEALKEELQDIEKRWERRLKKFYFAGIEQATYRLQLAVLCQDRLRAQVTMAKKRALESQENREELAQLRARKNSAAMHQADLLKRRNQLDFAKSTGGELSIEIHEAARIDDVPVSPRKARIMALALVLGLMLGSGLAFLKDWRDHRLRSSDEMASIMAAPVLGVLPHVREADEITTTGRRVYLKPDSFDAEAYRAIRTSIKFNTLELDPRILLITSPTSGDGKSTITSNLAISMAQMGKRVLILDCDLRRSTQHLIFAVNGQASASPATLPGVLSDQDGLEHLIVPTGIDGLDLLPCLTGVSNPGEIINSHKFALLLKDLSERYDLVLVDSPPVMPVADARVLGTLCDATIVVLRAERSTRKAAELTRDGLESVGAQILGVVVNDVPKRKGGHGYYGYYGASRYYRYDKYHYRGSHKNGKGEGHDIRNSHQLLPQQAPMEDRTPIDT